MRSLPKEWGHLRLGELGVGGGGRSGPARPARAGPASGRARQGRRARAKMALVRPSHRRPRYAAFLLGCSESPTVLREHPQSHPCSHHLRPNIRSYSKHFRPTLTAPRPYRFCTCIQLNSSIESRWKIENEGKFFQKSSNTVELLDSNAANKV